MSLKQEIETWVSALEFYDKQDYEGALKNFADIADTSKILFNCGVIHATLGEHDKAVEKYQRAVEYDKYLAIAYFQQGVSNFLVGDFEEALANFNDTLLYLRGHRFIDYDQLGLKFKLYSCEVLFNRGLCYIYLNGRDSGMNDLIFAAKEKETQDHDVIDEAIKEQAEGYTVFSIPVGVVYRPNASKVKNLKTKDYLGKARLIASADKSNVHTNFAGAEKKSAELAAVKAGEEREKDQVSFAASNLVRNDLTSRARQQSEPPLNRNMFPPTPPPEEGSRFASSARSVAPSDSISLTSRANSIRSGAAPYRNNSKLQIQTKAQPSLPEEAGPSSSVTLPAEAFDPHAGGDSLSPLASPPSSMKSQRPRLGVRTGSEPPRRAQTFDDSMSARGRSRADEMISPKSRGGQRQRLYGEVTEEDEDADTEDINDELYDLYNQTASGNPYSKQPPARERSATRAQSKSRRDRSSSRRRPSTHDRDNVTSMYPPSESDTSRSGHSSLEGFEMLPGPRGVPASLQAGGPGLQQHRRNQSEQARSQVLPIHSRTSSYASPMNNTYMAYGAPAEIKNIRVKIHHLDESRYLMVDATTQFDDFERKSKDKLKLRGNVKIKMRDEEDPTSLITVGDADDWDMAMESSRRDARNRGEEMGRLEVWMSELL